MGVRIRDDKADREENGIFVDRLIGNGRKRWSVVNGRDGEQEGIAGNTEFAVRYSNRYGRGAEGIGRRSDRNRAVSATAGKCDPTLGDKRRVRRPSSEGEIANRRNRVT